MNTFKYRFNIWRKKDFSSVPRYQTFISRFYQTSSKVANCRQIRQTIQGIAKGVSAGVKGFECGIKGGLNDNAPTGESRHIRAGGHIEHVVISIVAAGIIIFNNYEAYYV